LPKVATCVVEPVASPAGDRSAQVEMPEAPIALRALEPRPANAWHWFVPDHPHAGSSDPKIGRACGELAYAVPSLCGSA
jgi:hypothetical protein